MTMTDEGVGDFTTDQAMDYDDEGVGTYHRPSDDYDLEGGSDHHRPLALTTDDDGAWTTIGQAMTSYD